MADYTPNLNLYKPNRLDTTIEVDVSLTDNFTKIDTAYGEVASLKDSVTKFPTTYARLSGATFSGTIGAPALWISDAIYASHNGKYIFKDHKNGNVSVSAAGENLILGYQNTKKILINQPIYSDVEIKGAETPFSFTPKNKDDNSDANRFFFSSARNVLLSSNQYEPAFMVQTTVSRIVHFAAWGGGEFWMNVHGNIQVNGKDVYHEGRIKYGTSSSPSGGSSGDIYVQI